VSITPASSIPISIDYTGRDYYSIRAELIARIQSRVPEWTASDPADFGVALVESFAYLGDLVSYYIDRTANENFINTATQRQSVLNIAQTYGYVPAGYRQAYTTLTFTNTSGTEVTIPAGTIVSGDVVIADTVQTVYFTTVSDLAVVEQVGASAGTADTTAYHGRPVTLVSDNATIDGELIGTSTSLPSMIFELGETPVVDGSIELYVQDGDVFSKWTQVQHLLDYGPTDLVFSIYLNENNNVYVTFGDGVSGVIPTLYSEIRAKYTVGGGVLGNVVPDTLISLYYVPGLTEGQITALQSVISVTNGTTAIGGSDPETTDQIRISAPLSLRANNRAVTLQDYADLALGVSGVGKANATAAVWTSVTVYIAPSRSASDSDMQPGLDDLGDPTLEYDRLKEDIESYLEDKILLGTSVTIQPPTYVDVIITIQYTKLPQYTTAEIENNIKIKLLDQFGYTGVNFQDTIYPQDIEFVLAQVNGVKVARVTDLHREGGSGLNTLIGDPDEIFRFTEANVSIGEI
jgi:hypothetical protein